MVRGQSIAADGHRRAPRGGVPACGARAADREQGGAGSGWECGHAGVATLVGRPVTEPADFVRALLAAEEGRLAYFYGTAGQVHGTRAPFPPDARRGGSGGAYAGARRARGVRAGQRRVGRRRAPVLAAGARSGAARVGPAQKRRRRSAGSRNGRVLGRWSSATRTRIAIGGLADRTAGRVHLALRADLHGRPGGRPRTVSAAPLRREARNHADARRGARRGGGDACGDSVPGADHRARARADRCHPDVCRRGAPRRAYRGDR